MRDTRTPYVLTLMLIAAAGNGLAQPGPTQAELNAASTNTTDWLMTRHGYDAQRYVDLDQINRDNAASLRPVCIYQTAFTGPFNTNPVVYQGVMYLTAGTSTMAVDATTCDLKWRHEWRTKARDTNLPNNRGVALKDGKVVRGTVDAFLIALDAETGELLWETPAADPEVGASFTMPPVIFEDLIIIGPAGSELGVRGWVGAFNLEDGSPVWRFNLIPNAGEPGAETWSDPESELIGGGAVWTPFGFDPTEARVYIPVANPA
ncbi:MAG TPA: pyrrolo-quinoline quinone, partial [Acidobacteria bacterium]|nr:pyrrolo-quinoline quinone [Acidobacteriota bacterium]